MPSIKDVAKHAGVSVTTVSRVLNNKGYISQQTRLKVEEAMKELDYFPNQIARALLKNQSFVLGVIVPDLSHPFFAELINWIEHTATVNNYKILVCNSLQEAEKEAKYINMLKQNRVDGIIMCSHSQEVEAYRNVGMPIVSFDRIISSSIPYVASDNFRGGDIATEHLIDQGCRKLLYISGPLNNNLLANRRGDAFQLRSMNAGVEWKILEGAHIKATFEDNWKFIEQNLDGYLGEYDGIFCSNDIMAYTLYIYAKEKGIQVPDQLKIIGYDYHSYTRMLKEPLLTTIKQPIESMGKMLCNSLIEQVEKRGVEETNNFVFDVELIKGNTT